MNMKCEELFSQLCVKGTLLKEGRAGSKIQGIRREYNIFEYTTSEPVCLELSI